MGMLLFNIDAHL